MPTPFDHLLVPTDFSGSADRALARAVDLAGRFGATLHLLHVVNEFDGEEAGAPGAQDRPEAFREQIRAEALEQLHTIAPAATDFTVRTEVTLAPGIDVAEAIHDYVEEESIDLVVMGTHGRQGIDRLVLGSVTDSLIRQAPCPIMALRDEGRDILEEEVAPFADVLAPIDFSEHSHEALRTSKVLAHQYNARLHLLFVAERRVVPTFSDTGLPGVGVLEMDPEIVENAQEALRQLEQGVGGPEVESAYHVQEGKVTEDIVEFAESHDVGLIVMATRGSTRRARFLVGSNTERVIRVAPCPVLVIPKSTVENKAS